MDPRETLTALLPPPRDDEPASLRQDIIDELSDHLACAYKREILRGVDSSIARQRVLERFGDPAALARGLWLDAMEGKIMLQRVMIVTCLIVILACLSLVGLVYIQSSRAAAQTAEANRKLSEALLAHAQKTNDVMLTKLGEMSEAIRNPRSLDWNPVKFLVTQDTPDGPPAAGCSVTIFPSDSPAKQISRTTDDSGVADIGLVQPGNYTYMLSVSRDRGTLSGSGKFAVEPGSRVSQRIVWPLKQMKPTPLHVRCDWPTDLEKAELVIEARFTLAPFEKDHTWWNSITGMRTGTYSVLLGPRASVREFVNSTGLYVWRIPTQTPRADMLPNALRMISEPAEPLKWAAGVYYVNALTVPRPEIPGAGTSTRLRFAILVCAHPQGGGRTYPMREEAPSEDELRAPPVWSGGSAMLFTDGLTIPRESWSKVNTGFEVRADQVNEWTIKLPEELIKSVREKLNNDSTSKPK